MTESWIEPGQCKELVSKHCAAGKPIANFGDLRTAVMN